MADKKFKLPITIVELVVYSLCALMALWGITYIVLGSVAANLVSYKSDLVWTNNYLANGTAGMGFLEQGLLVLASAVLVSVVFLLAYSKNADRTYEKEQRRAAARASRRQFNTEETVVDVETTPAE